jgi:hypothetical protein
MQIFNPPATNLAPLEPRKRALHTMGPDRLVDQPAREAEPRLVTAKFDGFLQILGFAYSKFPSQRGISHRKRPKINGSSLFFERKNCITNNKKKKKKCTPELSSKKKKKKKKKKSRRSHIPPFSNLKKTHTYTHI